MINVRASLRDFNAEAVRRDRVRYTIVYPKLFMLSGVAVPLVSCQICIDTNIHSSVTSARGICEYVMTILTK
jgi:hypothetical protein